MLIHVTLKNVIKSLMLFKMEVTHFLVLCFLALVERASIYGITNRHGIFSRVVFDAMHAVTGAYAKPIFVDRLGANLV